MAEYAGTFPAGFGALAARALKERAKGARVCYQDDSLMHYEYRGAPPDMPGFSNAFLVLSARSGATTFAGMAARVQAARAPFPRGGRDFRVRFSRAGKLEAAPPGVMQAIEREIQSRTGARPNRAGGQDEYWFLLRDGGYGIFAKRLGSREPEPRRGELRPECAYLLCVLADVRPGQTVCDPFSGYGAIPAQLRARFAGVKVVACDFDAQRVSELRRAGFDAFRADARTLERIPDGSLDRIVTDPPWGDYARLDDADAFYADFLTTARAKLKSDGKMALLTAYDADRAIARADLRTRARHDVLVNGHKARAYLLGAR